jgi:hypothetical protein
VAQEVEYLPHKHEALNSNPSADKKNSSVQLCLAEGSENKIINKKNMVFTPCPMESVYKWKHKNIASTFILSYV